MTTKEWQWSIDGFDATQLHAINPDSANHWCRSRENATSFSNLKDFFPAFVVRSLFRQSSGASFLHLLMALFSLSSCWGIFFFVVPVHHSLIRSLTLNPSISLSFFFSHARLLLLCAFKFVCWSEYIRSFSHVRCYFPILYMHIFERWPHPPQLLLNPYVWKCV